jgi:hypothetical protein
MLIVRMNTYSSDTDSDTDVMQVGWCQMGRGFFASLLLEQSRAWNVHFFKVKL